MNEIAVEFMLKPDDYLKALRDFQTRKTFSWLISGWLGLPLLVLLILSFFSGNIDASNFGRFVFGLAFGLAALMYPFSIPAATKRQRIKAQNNKITQRYVFSEEGISMASDEYELKHNWSLMKEISESKNFYFLIQVNNPDALQFVPKNAFQSQEQDKVFRDMIGQHLSVIAPIDKGIRGWKLWALTNILSLAINLSVFMMIGD